MVESKEDSKNSEEFDISTELSTLVSNNVIPSRLAERLENKLKEKKIQITREQFLLLIDKIKDIMSSYEKNSKTPEKEETTKKELTTSIKKDEDIQKIFETIEELKEKITTIEKGKISKPKIVTTDDIKIPEGVIDTVQKLNVDSLTEIPTNPESVIILMKWLQYLIDKCGRPNLTNILDYYVDIGWISEDVKISLVDYSHGITEKENKQETGKKHKTDLPSKDHIQSLIYLQKLKGLQFDNHFIDRIESELSRISKKINQH
jgi:flagellar protein FlaD